MSLREYARHRGVSPTAVSRAKKVGILRRCLTPEGKIISASAADAEWDAGSYADRQPLSGPTSPKSRHGDADPEPHLGDARARHELAKAQLAEIDLAERRGELVKVAELDGKLASLFTSCKTKLLGIPSRARQADPTLSTVQIALVEELVREALEDLAEGKLEVDAA
jgi:hypothetical protein